MTRSAALRIALYLLIASAIGVGVVSVRTYPEEHTLIDRYLDWRSVRDSRPRVLHRDCGWRVVFCEELPPVPEAIRASWDSATRGLDVFDCDFRLMTYCYASKGDTVVSLLVAHHPEAAEVTRSWAPNDLPREYIRIESELTKRYGPARPCPQSDDLAFKEDEKWQLEGRYLGINKVMDSLFQLTTGDGKIGCDIGP